MPSTAHAHNQQQREQQEHQQLHHQAPLSTPAAPSQQNTPHPHPQQQQQQQQQHQQPPNPPYRARGIKFYPTEVCVFCQVAPAEIELWHAADGSGHTCICEDCYADAPDGSANTRRCPMCRADVITATPRETTNPPSNPSNHPQPTNPSEPEPGGGPPAHHQ